VSKFLPAAVLAALLATGCGPVATSGPVDLSDRETVKVVATTGMVGDLVERIAGERVELEQLMGPGVDPHLYKASERDVLALADADVIFFSGLHLEAKLADVLERIEGRVVTQAVTDAIPRERLLRPPAFEGAYDPHVWFDVTLWSGALIQVRDTFVELDPAHADLYRANAETALAEFEELDAEVRALAATVPADKRVLITAHDAFLYFGRAYGFDVRGLQGISTVSEAGAADVNDLAEFIAEEEIPAIFVESSVPRQTIRAVQEAVRARGFDVEIGGELFSDAMGDPDTQEGTYPGMVRHNVETIAEALRG
jgi:manganese/zinc/iron transport system substrate-binding protein